MQHGLWRCVVVSGRPEWVKRQCLALLSQGCSALQVQARTGVYAGTVSKWARQAGLSLALGRRGGLAVRPTVMLADVEIDEVVGAVAAAGCGHGRRLTVSERTVIQFGVVQGWSRRRIAAVIGVAVSTVTRELARSCPSRAPYRPDIAQRRADRARARPKPRKLDEPGLRVLVVSMLNEGYSPEQVAGRLRRMFPDRDDRYVSAETIYQALYVQAAGGLRHELTVAQALRHGRTSRRPRSRLPRRSGRPWLAGHEISTRPAAAADRAIPGHWEGDLVIGTDGRTALITLVERRSRFTLLHRLSCHDAATVSEALGVMVERLPSTAISTLTWDQGVEMAQWPSFAVARDIKVFFCDPHSPWQRPTNENTNGLARQYFPKSTNFDHVTDDDVLAVETLLNNRPRHVLDFATPTEMMGDLISVALTG